MPAVDRDTLSIYQSVSTRSALTRMVFTTRNQRMVPYQFLDGNTVVELAAGSTGELIVKKSGDYATLFARAQSWSKVGSGTSAVYWFLLDLATDELTAEFATATKDFLENFVLELTFTENGNVQTPPRTLCTIYNRYLQPAEGQPNPASPAWPEPSNLLLKTEQNLSTEEKAQVRENIDSLNRKWEAKAEAFSAVAGGRYLVDTNAGAFVASLPPAPEVGDQVEFADAKNTWAENNFSIGRNGLKIAGGDSDLVCDVSGAAVVLVYQGVDQGWRVL